MLFNSFQFLIFLPLVYGIFESLKTQTSRLWLFFFASCFFYSFLIPKYLLILFVLIAVDFWAGIGIENSKTQVTRKSWLVFSLIANVGMLAFFKYFNFFLGNVNAVAALLDWKLPIEALQLALPIGLSFHTFQSLSYVFEVYHGRFPAEKNLLRYSVYVLYFPQLVAGPIERPQNILPQLREKTVFDYARMVRGFYLMAQGLFKKAVIADSLALLVNQVFDRPSEFGIIATALGVLFFTFQIYCDFSGYSDIARGVSSLFGIELMVNFKKPYFSSSISEFWRRWHISLSTWFRDYLYIPLGGNRTGPWRRNFNLLVVFLVSGLWHGANWTFIIWGGLHGIYLLTENLILNRIGFERLPLFLRRAYVFFLVSLAWVFFRATDMANAIGVFRGLQTSPWKGMGVIPEFQISEGLIAILALFMVEWIDEQKDLWGMIRDSRWIFRWGIYWIMAILFLLTAQFAGHQFIYFQF